MDNNDRDDKDVTYGSLIEGARQLLLTIGRFFKGITASGIEQHRLIRALLHTHHITAVNITVEVPVMYIP